MANVTRLKYLKPPAVFRSPVLQRPCSIKSNVRSWPKRVLSGIQPTGTLHLGNYFGAVEKWKHLQDKADGDVILSIVDLHSITFPQDPKTLRTSILRMTATLIACGIDPGKCILFQQSKVPQHVLLGWVLGSLTTMARLYHFPQYKEKSESLKDIPLGLFVYPVLQAADILLYKSTHVPVGEDQVQHLHLAQHLVHAFNNKYGVTFPIPEYLVEAQSGAGRIKSLKEPGRKMSKSHPDQKSRIEITDSPDEIRSKIKKALTDFTSEVEYDPENRPGVSNLIDIHALATNKNRTDIVREAAGLDTGQYKLVVAEAVIAKLAPIRAELMKLLDSKEYLDNVLAEGSAKAETIAAKTWEEVSRKIGFDDRHRTKKVRLVSEPIV
ncbi:tryptophanyl-tRNA synthetase [Nesidiocoris tenuis]|uniref:tryptophan--tRNA ligase n=1 Tax=Nesidiocoris tenuis TaxID=355587 RepID=A0ABN7AL09_9HEMI|nr:tryptophanyl-tRNA synthetase [Nesidiocoris tenuis]